MHVSGPALRVNQRDTLATNSRTQQACGAMVSALLDRPGARRLAWPTMRLAQGATAKPPERPHRPSTEMQLLPLRRRPKRNRCIYPFSADGWCPHRRKFGFPSLPCCGSAGPSIDCAQRNRAFRAGVPTANGKDRRGRETMVSWKRGRYRSPRVSLYPRMSPPSA